MAYFEWFIDVTFPFDTELDVIECLRPWGCVIDVLTFDERNHFAGKEARNRPFDARAFHFALQFVEQDSKEFLVKIISNCLNDMTFTRFHEKRVFRCLLGRHVAWMNRAFPIRNSWSVSSFQLADRWTEVRKILAAEQEPHFVEYHHSLSAFCTLLCVTVKWICVKLHCCCIGDNIYDLLD